MNAARKVLITLSLFALPASAARAQSSRVRPVLEFPETGMDDRAAYQGYQTRFFRDKNGNLVQVYLDARSGRVVNLLIDALDESVGFTARDSSGKPVALEWASNAAVVSTAGSRRTIEYRLRADAPVVNLGLLLLNSMRVERDLGYSGRQVARFELPTFRLPEQELLISNVDRLPAGERQRQLTMLGARDGAELRARLTHAVTPLTAPNGDIRGIRASQSALDGKTHLELELAVDPRRASVTVAPAYFSIRRKSAAPIEFTVRVTTDGPPLTPLTRTQIFNSQFLAFLAAKGREASDRRGARNRAADSAARYRYRQLERDVLGTELLSSKEKLMAGLPNYATYFGRDMMMSALMMEPVWQPSMFEHVIASALNKLGPNGDVSHEEALGGQAIRENSSEYNAHMAEYFRLSEAGDVSRADTALANARALLVNLQRVRENYHMRDDEFQLPILVARYLANRSISDSQKRAFLTDSSSGRGPRVGLLVRELGLVTNLAAPYAQQPVALNLLGSPRLDSTHWRSVSWRDSDAGYGNGRFAMDINAIWVPRALEATADILASLRRLKVDANQAVTARDTGPVLADFARDPSLLQRAIETWRGAVQHFVVKLSTDEVSAGVTRKLQTLPVAEREYWQRVLSTSRAAAAPLEFVALSLYESGKPVPVVNTDPATWIFLQDSAWTQPSSRARALRDVHTFVREFPVALFVDGLGPLVANDAYAAPSVQEAFAKDLYHSPRVVWGREVNLIMLGLAKQILASMNSSGQPRSPELGAYASELKGALNRINAAVDASGLKHNELWSYEIAAGKLVPIRYGASTDVQLWNVTDLAVQYTLSLLPH